jgi:hypothetical protein
MGNVLRILGIVAASMVAGIAALVLLLFTVCGGFDRPSREGTMTVAICLACIGGAVTAIIFLARGIKPSASYQAGLAVPPSAPIASGADPGGAYPGAVYPGAAYTAQPAPAVALTGTELQWLIFLRIALGAYVLLAFASTAIGSVALARLQPRILMMVVTQSVLNVLPSVLALFVLRNPPSGLAVDLAMAPAAASILYRLFYTGGMVIFSGMLQRMPQPATFLLRLAMFTALEAAIIWLGAMVRRRVDAGNYGRLIGLILAFLIYEAFGNVVAYLFY